jgi:carbonic anhydrase
MKTPRTLLLPLAALTGSLLCTTAMPGCASHQETRSSQGLLSAVTEAQQRAMTPDAALDRLVEGNRRFVSGRSLQRDLTAQRTATASGQHPFAVVLSCIDSRSAPEIVFDQGIGDVFSPRIAGNYSNADILGSMEFATKVAGARVIVVMGHTECGAVKGACDNVQLGNLTTVIQAIRPAVESVQNVPGDRSSSNARFVSAATEMNVRQTVARIRSDSEIIRELERSGQIKVVGAMHDLATGRVALLPDTAM